MSDNYSANFYITIPKNRFWGLISLILSLLIWFSTFESYFWANLKEIFSLNPMNIEIGKISLLWIPINIYIFLGVTAACATKIYKQLAHFEEDGSLNLWIEGLYYGPLSGAIIGIVVSVLIRILNWDIGYSLIQILPLFIKTFTVIVLIFCLASLILGLIAELNHK